MTLQVQHFYDESTNGTGTLSYLIHCTETKKAAIIDPLLEFDVRACKTNTQFADKIIQKVEELKLDVQWILETHIHADHLTSSKYLQDKLAATQGSRPPICIGAKIVEVIKYWTAVYNAQDIAQDGTQFDKLFHDGEEFEIGSIRVKVMYTPGHTPACITYYLPECNVAFCGDTIFSPKVGNARADFPGGSPTTLFQSARKLLSLPESTVLYVGHDYPEDGIPVTGTTVREHKETNCTLNDRVAEHEFVKANSDSLPVPRLMIPSIQVNIRAGGFGDKEANGSFFLKFPINKF